MFLKKFIKIFVVVLPLSPRTRLPDFSQILIYRHFLVSGLTPFCFNFDTAKIKHILQFSKFFSYFFNSFTKNN